MEENVHWVDDHGVSPSVVARGEVPRHTAHGEVHLVVDGTEREETMSKKGQGE